MNKQKLNGFARWVIVALAVGSVIFNTAVLYNDVKHLKNAVQEIKQEIRDLRTYLLENK